MKSGLFFSVVLILGSVGKLVAEDTARVLVPKEVFTTGNFRYHSNGNNGGPLGVSGGDLNIQVGPLIAKKIGNGGAADPKLRAELSSAFRAALEDCTVVTYTAEGIDKKITACHAELKAAEERVTKVIVESTSTIPVAVLEQLAHQAEEKVKAQMQPKIAALEARIQALEQRLASGPATVGGSADPTKGE